MQNGFKCSIDANHQLSSCLVIDGKPYCQSMDLRPVIKVIKNKIAAAHDGVHRDDMVTTGADYSYMINQAKKVAAAKALQASGARAINDQRSGANRGGPVVWSNPVRDQRSGGHGQGTNNFRMPGGSRGPAEGHPENQQTAPFNDPYPAYPPQSPYPPQYPPQYGSPYGYGPQPAPYSDPYEYYDDGSDYEDTYYDDDSEVTYDTNEDGTPNLASAPGGVAVSGWFDDIKSFVRKVQKVIKDHKNEIATASNLVAPGSGQALLAAYAASDQVDKAMAGDPKATQAIADLKADAKSGDPAAKRTLKITRQIYLAKVTKANESAEPTKIAGSGRSAPVQAVPQGAAMTTLLAPGGLPIANNPYGYPISIPYSTTPGQAGYVYPGAFPQYYQPQPQYYPPYPPQYHDYGYDDDGYDDSYDDSPQPKVVRDHR